MANLFNRAGMATATAGAGTLTLGAALGAVPANLAAFQSFSAAGVADQNTVSYLILDANGGWETGYGTYTASGTSLTRNVTASSNANAAITLSGSAQVFITARAEDIATVEALACAGIQINGNMEISQWGGSTAISLVSGTDSYIADGTVAGFHSASMVCNGQVVACPGSPPFGTALPFCVQLKATTGAALLTADYAGFHQAIEGIRFARCRFGAAGALPVTIGFWFYHPTVSGNIAVSLRNAATTRGYPVDVSVTAGVWKWVTVIIPGDTGGTWLNGGNQVGAYVGICCGTGATYQGTANAWNALDAFGTSSTTNFFASNNNLACITCLVVLPGAHVLTPEMSPLLMRHSVDEIPICRRYYEQSYSLGAVPGAITNAGLSYNNIAGFPSGIITSGTMVSYKTSKASASPTITYYSPGTGAAGKARDFVSSADITPTTTGANDNGFEWSAAMSAAGTQSNMGVHWTSDCRLL